MRPVNILAYCLEGIPYSDRVRKREIGETEELDAEVQSR